MNYVKKFKATPSAAKNHGYWFFFGGGIQKGLILTDTKPHGQTITLLQPSGNFTYDQV
jgi:hypothetical protein